MAPDPFLSFDNEGHDRGNVAKSRSNVKDCERIMACASTNTLKMQWLDENLLQCARSTM